MITNVELADEIVKRMPIMTAETCLQHDDGVHVHIICKHGKLAGDFIVEFDSLWNTQTKEVVFWDSDKETIPNWVIKYLKGFLD